METTATSEHRTPEVTLKLTFKERLETYQPMLSIAGLIVLLDQVSKAVLRAQLAFGESWMPIDWLAPYARIIHWHNTGAAFGMFQSGGAFFKVLGLVVSGLILYYYPAVPKKDWSLRLAMALQLGGALGNFIDRVRFGYVTDFVSLMNFPVFNVADTCITIGVIVLIWGVWVSELEAKKQMAAESGDADERSVDGG
ncbi:MAG: signal peptidase II [Anaerolineae bacterium]|nr:MAG: signal peptidase II [Anaerolineae bacterium]